MLSSSPADLQRNVTYKNNINFTVVNGLNQSNGEKAFDYNTKQYIGEQETYIYISIYKTNIS
jgi:hypothetical protein